MGMFKPFSKKQKKLLTWWFSTDHKNKCGIICDGAVRSGKTLCMSLAFVLWSGSCFRDKNFAICGKTISSLRRNVISPLTVALKEMGISYREKISKNYLEITLEGNKNRYYLFSGKDESSASLIQGITLAGVMFDETALMPRSFVEQALARCSVAGAKYWFNCNPENPYHWFYREWILKCEEKNVLHLHFKMEDNPSLSKEIIDRYKSLYSGTFYQRYIEGKWTAAEGRIYTMFDEKVHVTQEIPKCEAYAVSCDYGTVNPFSVGLWGISKGIYYRVAEVYYNSRERGEQKTDEEYYDMLDQLCSGFSIEKIIVDPSAASFIQCIKRKGKYVVQPADNDVLTGINAVSQRLKDKKLFIHSSCKDTIREFSLYRWEPSSPKDIPIKENDHAMDDIRYFVMSYEKEKFSGSFFAVCAGRKI